ncbi:signal recognition particle receptor beta subunit-domain-containing protein [Blyttiomyces helicus]|uniref:Signal recognition particle receptor subunit beta n=1 Tax=Blyttiomyces helicus TaxID=388810 RepID=A0A4P9WLM5_9FUNG|nr:signal recognition particle receptor beta subunit-domain-containing protein [Blyttiomyces helicus]|eukprot:RKO93322.1 signal recognition particle receptor beta subunit-domain-containing protein [Blyttiomyces helicus]
MPSFLDPLAAALPDKIILAGDRNLTLLVLALSVLAFLLGACRTTGSGGQKSPHMHALVWRILKLVLCVVSTHTDIRILFSIRFRFAEIKGFEKRHYPAHGGRALQWWGSSAVRRFRQRGRLMRVPLWAVLQLRYGKVAETRTSMTENQARFVLFSKEEEIPSPPKPVRIIDVPGHEKLRFKYAEFIPECSGIIFMLDSGAITRDVRRATEYLYDLLVNPHTQKLQIPVLIVCNKADSLLALNEKKVQELLESEINRLRTTRAAQVDSLDDDRADDFLGYEKEAFRFEHISNQIDFVTTSLVSGDSKGLDTIVNFVTQFSA